MSFTKDNLEKFSKQQIIEVVLKLQDTKDKEVNKLKEELHNLASKVDELLENNNKLLSKESITENVSLLISERIDTLETELYAQQQYSRRECLEIVGIDNSIQTEDLEENVIELFDEIGVDINSSDIQACHRLKKRDTVIIKFSNRKDVHKILLNKKKLKTKGKRVFINESLCPKYRKFLGKANRLVKNNLAKNTFTRNGIVKIKLNNDEVMDIVHDNFFKLHFPDFSFPF